MSSRALATEFIKLLNNPIFYDMSMDKLKLYNAYSTTRTSTQPSMELHTKVHKKYNIKVRTSKLKELNIPESYNDIPLYEVIKEKDSKRAFVEQEFENRSFQRGNKAICDWICLYGEKSTTSTYNPEVEAVHNYLRTTIMEQRSEYHPPSKQVLVNDPEIDLMGSSVREVLIETIFPDVSFHPIEAMEASTNLKRKFSEYPSLTIDRSIHIARNLLVGRRKAIMSRNLVSESAYDLSYLSASAFHKFQIYSEEPPTKKQKSSKSYDFEAAWLIKSAIETGFEYKKSRLHELVSNSTINGIPAVKVFREAEESSVNKVIKVTLGFPIQGVASIGTLKLIVEDSDAVIMEHSVCGKQINNYVGYERLKGYYRTRRNRVSIRLGKFGQKDMEKNSIEDLHLSKNFLDLEDQEKFDLIFSILYYSRSLTYFTALANIPVTGDLKKNIKKYYLSSRSSFESDLVRALGPKELKEGVNERMESSNHSLKRILLSDEGDHDKAVNLNVEVDEGLNVIHKGKVRRFETPLQVLNEVNTDKQPVSLHLSIEGPEISKRKAIERFVRNFYEIPLNTTDVTKNLPSDVLDSMVPYIKVSDASYLRVFSELPKFKKFNPTTKMQLLFALCVSKVRRDKLFEDFQTYEEDLSRPLTSYGFEFEGLRSNIGGIIVSLMLNKVTGLFEYNGVPIPPEDIPKGYTIYSRLKMTEIFTLSGKLPESRIIKESDDYLILRSTYGYFRAKRSKEPDLSGYVKRQRQSIREEFPEALESEEEEEGGSEADSD